MRSALLAVCALVLAGCAQPASPPTATTPSTPTPPTGAPSNETEGIRISVALASEFIRPGDEALVELRLENEGPPVTYADGGCGPTPWVVELVAANGTVVAPLPPDPRCLGPPMRELPLRTGESLWHNLTWDGFRRWRDAELNVHEEPAPAGWYVVRAQAPVQRDGATIAPVASVVLEVGARR